MKGKTRKAGQPSSEQTEAAVRTSASGLLPVPFTDWRLQTEACGK